MKKSTCYCCAKVSISIHRILLALVTEMENTFVHRHDDELNGVKIEKDISNRCHSPLDNATRCPNCSSECATAAQSTNPLIP